MNNQFDANKIPKFVYLLLGTIVAVVLFMIFVGYPLIENASTMQSEHQKVLQDIRSYDNALKLESKIEAEIKKNQEEFDIKEKELFVDADASSRDIERYCRENNIDLTSFNLGEPSPDPRGRVSTSGYPVYTVSIAVSYRDTYEKTMSFMKYLEEGSNGCYYINNCSLSADEDVTKATEFNTTMAFTLYYYDRSEAEVATEAATEAETK